MNTARRTVNVPVSTTKRRYYIERK